MDAKIQSHLKAALDLLFVWVLLPGVSVLTRLISRVRSHVATRLWQTLRSEACRLLGLPQRGEERLQQRKKELQDGLYQLDRELARDSDVRIEDGKLVLSLIEAVSLAESTIRLRELIIKRLPRLDLTELLIKVDGWTHFTDCFEHAGGGQPRTRDLLSMRFSPRIRNLGDQQIYRMDRSISYPHLDPILKQTINQKRILEHWDDILRVASSMKLGWVTASLLIGKLQTPSRKSALTRAIQEYGRIIKSTDIPHYLCHEEHRRRVGIQLNKGEEFHKLRRFLLFANGGEIRKAHIENQDIQAVIDQLQSEGYVVEVSDLVHVSPCRFRHINKHGKYQLYDLVVQRH